MKRTSKVPFILIIVCLFFFLFCSQDSRLENLQKRLDAFRNILSQELREKFDSGSHQDVVAGLDSLLTSDLTFKRQYEELKDEEAINVFSTREVVDYYQEYFVEEIKRLKGKKR